MLSGRMEPESKCLEQWMHTNLWLLAHAGLHVFCQDGVEIVNSGNVPMAYKATRGGAQFSDGSPCQGNKLQPTERQLCDLTWTLEQANMESGEAIIQLAVVGNDTSDPQATAAYTGSTKLFVAINPGVALELEQKGQAGLVIPGAKGGVLLASRRGACAGRFRYCPKAKFE